MADELKGQAPLFGGSTGGLLSKAQIEEKYAITWTSPKEQVFEMPTGGAAVMRQGDNTTWSTEGGRRRRHAVVTL